jgi:hypothetical protein
MPGKLILRWRQIALFFIFICIMAGIAITANAVIKQIVFNRDGVQVIRRQAFLEKFGEQDRAESHLLSLLQSAARSQPENGVVSLRVVGRSLSTYECNLYCDIQSLVMLELYGCKVPDGYTAKMISANPSLQIVVLDQSECDLSPVEIIAIHRHLYGIFAFQSIIPEDQLRLLSEQGIRVYRDQYFRLSH